MSLFDFFFPEQAQASHLRSLASSARTRNRRNIRKTGDLDRRIDDLEKDLGYVSLVLGALVQQLDAKGTLSRDDLRTVLAELDELDGVKDGRLDIDILRGMGN